MERRCLLSLSLSMPGRNGTLMLGDCCSGVSALFNASSLSAARSAPIFAAGLPPGGALALRSGGDR